MRREMQLLSVLCVARLLTGGTTSEAEMAWPCVIEIAETLGDADYQLRGLWGFYGYRSMTGGYREALALAEQFHSVAINSDREAAAVTGERMIGAALHLLGDQAGARTHLKRALDSTAAFFDRRHLLRFHMDQRVAAHCILARTLWLQGLPDQAMRNMRTGIELAQTVQHPLSLLYALIQGACPVALLAGDIAAADRAVTMLFDLSGRRTIVGWNGWDRCYQGVLLAKQGEVAIASRMLRAALGDLAETKLHHLFDYTFLTAELANALGRAGEAAPGLAAIEAALALSERNAESWCVAELLRIKGELLLLQAEEGAAAAGEDCFRQALDCARRQGTLSWELPAAASLARLLHDQGRSAEAAAQLQPVYARFSEGFDTADLKDAKALLDALAAPSAQWGR